MSRADDVARERRIQADRQRIIDIEAGKKRKALESINLRNALREEISSFLQDMEDRDYPGIESIDFSYSVKKTGLLNKLFGPSMIETTMGAWRVHSTDRIDIDKYVPDEEYYLLSNGVFVILHYERNHIGGYILSRHGQLFYPGDKDTERFLKYVRELRRHLSK